MKEISFRIEEDLLEQARLIAQSQDKTLNDLFCEWLQQLVPQTGDAREVRLLMGRLRHVKAGRKLSREERNKR
ncbi:MAG TPA: hypothetical protein VLN58_08465 [Verrucomicrobiae bacterium]|nr:hypothetical protein [Verrucomicrobiae bacterium]